MWRRNGSISTRDSFGAPAAITSMIQLRCRYPLRLFTHLLNCTIFPLAPSFLLSRPGLYGFCLSSVLIKPEWQRENKKHFLTSAAHDELTVGFWLACLARASAIYLNSACCRVSFFIFGMFLVRFLINLREVVCMCGCLCQLQ
jgi:hypothetical protein